jgi:hypothetical protein
MAVPAVHIETENIKKIQVVGLRLAATHINNSVTENTLYVYLSPTTTAQKFF